MAIFIAVVTLLVVAVMPHLDTQMVAQQREIGDEEQD